MPSRHPFSVTLLIWMVLSLSGWGTIRFLSAWHWWDVLREFGSRLDPLYLSITGVFWAIAGIFLLWSLWVGKPWSGRAILGFAIAWLAEYWIERVFFQSPRANLPFALIITILLLSVVIANVSNRYTKNFIAKSEEHEQSNKTTTPARPEG